MCRVSDLYLTPRVDAVKMVSCYCKELKECFNSCKIRCKEIVSAHDNRKGPLTLDVRDVRIDPRHAPELNTCRTSYPNHHQPAAQSCFLATAIHPPSMTTAEL